MRAHAGELSCQKLRLLGAVADAGDHRVFKRHPPPGDFIIVLTCRQHFFDVPAFIDRHNFVSRLVVRRVKRHRERQLQLPLCQKPDFIDQTAGGQADVAHADVQSVRAVNQLEKLHDRIKIVQRLPDAHQHNVGNRKSGIDLAEQHLVQKLRRSESAHQSAKRRRTELAAHQAADLRGDTHGVAMVILHHNGLHAVAVGQLPEVFDRAVEL